MNRDARTRLLLAGGYSLHDYGGMLGSRVRVDAHRRALAAVVRPDSVVVELGAGVGTFALAACRLGARRVYAIEPDPSIELGPRLAEDNGMADRLVCHRGMGSEVTLPEPADVLVFDLRGTMPFFRHSVAAIADARTRLLKPGGAMIPQRDVLMLGIVHAPQAYRDLEHPWTGAFPDLDLRRARTLALNNWTGIRGTDVSLVSSTASWGTLDYRTAESTPFLGDASCVVTDDALAHGFLAWFDAELAPGIGFTNAPGAGESVYGRAFFPWPEPQALRRGDVVELRLRVIDGHDQYVWTWDTRIASVDGTVRATFQQSTFLGEIFAQAELAKRVDSYVVPRSNSLDVARDVLALADGRRSLGQIAAEIRARHPEAFENWNDALAHVADLLSPYSAADHDGA